jgi:hypothetical protein
MQEGEVGWDPISISYHPPVALRLFVFYVLIVLLVSLVKSLRLSSHLWLFPNRKRTLWKNSNEKQLPGSMAPAALARNFREILKTDLRQANLLSRLRQAEAEFLYVWQLYVVRAESIKKLCVLTILVAVWVSLILGIQTLTSIGYQKVASLALVSGSIIENLTSLEIGVFAAVVLYAQYFVLERALGRRKATWDYVLSTVAQAAEHRV